MAILLQIIINGLIAGSIYALVAVGFSLVYSTNRFIHFAHGAVITLAAYFLYYIHTILGVDIWFASFLTIVFTSFVGLMMNLLIYHPLREKGTSPQIMLIASIALLMLLESVILLFFGAELKTIELLNAQSINIFGAYLTPLQIILIASSPLLLGVFYYFTKRSRLGKAMRAVADNKTVAEIVGISSESVYSWSIIISSALAGISGILIGLEQNLEPTMGTHLMIRGFVGAVIGGIGSVPGAILGGLLVGLVENVGIWFLPSGYKDAIAFGLLFIFLLIRPNGILPILKKGTIND